MKETCLWSDSRDLTVGHMRVKTDIWELLTANKGAHNGMLQLVCIGYEYFELVLVSTNMHRLYCTLSTL